MINVLDHGFVRLVSYMQPSPEIHEVDNLDSEYYSTEEKYGRAIRPFGWTGDLEVVRNARVSYDADWRTGEDEGKDEKLLDYMLRNKHTSPFEAMVFTFEVKAPIFVLRQWHRHRTWSYNELSARYAPMQEEFYVPQVGTIGHQSSDNKQARTLDDPNAVWEGRVGDVMEGINRDCFNAYKGLLEFGVPRELARTVLPLSIYSRMFATVDLHNLIHFFRLRIHPHAQYEIRQYAEALLQLIDPVVPIVTRKFREGLIG